MRAARSYDDDNDDDDADGLLAKACRDDAPVLPLYIRPLSGTVCQTCANPAATAAAGDAAAGAPASDADADTPWWARLQIQRGRRAAQNDAAAESMLLRALRSGHAACVGCAPVADCVRDPTNHASDIVELRYRAINAAAARGDDAVVRALVSRGVDVNAYNPEDGSFPIIMAARNGHVAVVRTLCEHGCNVEVCRSHQGDLPITLAAREGHHSVIVALARAGSQINAKNHNGSTPLLRACEEGHVEAVKVLLMLRADCNLPNKFSTSPALAAARSGFNDVVALLGAAGSNLNVPDRDGWTPLAVAVSRGRLKMMETLLIFGAQVGHLRTPEAFHNDVVAGAFGRSDVEVVHLLLDGGAPVHAQWCGGMFSILELCSPSSALQVLQYGAGASLPL